MSETTLELPQQQELGGTFLLVLFTTTITITFTGVVMLGPLLLVRPERLATVGVAGGRAGITL